MSYYYHSVPKNIVFMMKDRYSLEAFVETGTYMGITAEWASRHFANVYTIEQLQEYFNCAQFKLMNSSNVHMFLNDSRIILPAILQNREVRKALFYLDAHWSEGARYGRPLVDSTALEEVLILNEWNNFSHVIIVDDAHRFGTERWPSKIDIIEALENKGTRHVRELMDVLIATPRRPHASIDDTPTDIISRGGERN